MRPKVIWKHPKNDLFESFCIDATGKDFINFTWEQSEHWSRTEFSGWLFSPAVSRLPRRKRLLKIKGEKTLSSPSSYAISSSPPSKTRTNVSLVSSHLVETLLRPILGLFLQNYDFVYSSGGQKPSKTSTHLYCMVSDVVEALSLVIRIRTMLNRKTKLIWKKKHTS